jgi:transcription termination factor Rho
VRGPKEGERYFALIKIETVNAVVPSGMRTKPIFEALTPIRADRRIAFTNGVGNVAAALVDHYLPIGFGQRVAVVAPASTDRLALYSDLIHGIRSNHPKAVVLMLLLDERPEEVTQVRSKVDAQVLFSTFDEPTERHVQVTDMAIERAKRLAEQGEDVVLFVDSLSRLARASHSSTPVGGKLMSSLVDITALQCVRRVFGAARCLEEGGSLTLFATLLSGSTFDDVVIEDLIGAANGVIRIDLGLDDAGQYPAFDLRQSRTRAHENYLSPAELEVVQGLRKALSGDVVQDMATAKKAIE